jgi:DNA recombination protein RmuC
MMLYLKLNVAMELLYLLIGILIGAIVAWLLTKFYYESAQNNYSSKSLQERYVLKAVHEAVQNHSDTLKADLNEREQSLLETSNQLSALQQTNLHLQEKLATQEASLTQLQEKFKIEFENIANRLLEEKSEKFTKHNQQQIEGILQPLREKITTFEANIHQKFREESHDRISLKKEIEHLRLLNAQLSEDAGNLVNALKGDSKTQGDWGEFQLEMLLEKSGLQKNVHFISQASYKDVDGKDKRPDFIVNLPNDKHLVIDSKVSLVAYEKFHNANDHNKRQKYLKAHIDSLKKHIKDLNSKNYQQLYQINSPDYLLLFVPIEGAFGAALREEQKLFTDALDRNIVLVTNSTLLATMRTVAFIWKQERQKKNVLEIARQSGLLYDKFCNFVNDLKAVGQRIDHAQSSYHDAMLKLSNGKRYGDTLIGRAEKIKNLGAKASKSLPKELLNLDDGEEELEIGNL